MIIFVFRSLVIACAALLSLALPLRAQERLVHIYNWSDYIDPKVLDDFTRETGIKVIYDTYDNAESVEAKLRAGRSSYDIVVSSGSSVQRLIKANLLRPLDKDKLPNITHVWPFIQTKMQTHDPGNRYAVPYLWGTLGLGLNVQKVRERLGHVPLNSWDILFKPENAAKLKDCGVMVLDAPEQVLPAALMWLGLPGDTKKQEDLARAADVVFRIRNSVRKFQSSNNINALANGDICLTFSYSSDIIQARKRAEEVKNNVEIAYLIPSQGSLLWLDGFVIPADAPHPQEAHAFINYMLRPEVAAANVNFVSYASSVLAAKPMVNEAILNDPNIYPDDQSLSHVMANAGFDDRFQRLIISLWTRVKTGR